MADGSTAVDYKPDQRAARTAGKPATAVEEFLQLLARAVRQFHTYPATSPLCTDAIAVCHKTFATLDRERLELRVTPHEFILDEAGIGARTIIEQELVHRLHRARVANLEIDRAATPRDLSRFCGDLIRAEDLAKTKATFTEMLAEHGVDTIVARLAHRPEVLEVGAPSAPASTLVEHERNRRQSASATGPVQYLYPPGKGWVRLDPAAKFDAISLIDLAVLVDDPAEVATMLLRLTDDDPVGPKARETALQQKFSDVSMLFGALDPRLARIMFGKLARAVLELDSDRRKELLKRTILPGLLDGRAAGNVLRDFPDVDLAESLCLLLDLETAAPEVVTTALDRLELPAERRDTVVPLIDQRLRDGHGGGRATEAGLDRYARRLIKVDAAAAKNFNEFAAFDLSVDAEAATVIAGVAGTIAATDLPVTQLSCLVSLVRLEPNPSVVEEFLKRALALVVGLERADRWNDVAAWISRFSRLAESLREARPDVSDAIVAKLSAHCDVDRVLKIAELYDEAPEGSAQRSEAKAGRQIATKLVAAFGAAMAPASVAVLEDPAHDKKARSLVPLMCEHSQTFAPVLAPRLGRCGVAPTRAIVRVLGFAGAGYEATIAAQLGQRDEQTLREALRALARIGTRAAAVLVSQQLQHADPRSRSAAEEALWHFPPAQTAEQLRDLLGRHDFVQHNPQLVSRLLDRAAQARTSGLDQALRGLEAFRFRFWNPALMRLARRARELRSR